MIKTDPLKRILYIDLTKKKFWVEERPDLFEKFLGGTGVAIALLQENCSSDTDPFSPENPIIFAVGPLNGLFPIASKTVAMFKSPHTGNLGESHAGGRSAIAIRMAGYGAIVIKGKSERPCYISIHGDKVFFRDATTLWGLEESAGRIIRTREPGAGLRTIMRIGPAGEKLVSFACVTLETYRHFGRLGLGTVFGSKNLKALLVSGKRDLSVTDFKEYKNLYSLLLRELSESEKMKKYHELGTPANVLPLSFSKGIPIKNLRTNELLGIENISGEVFAQKHLGRRVACCHCPVACIHLAALRKPYEDEPYFYRTVYLSYDYELIYALGSMLGITSSEDILKLIEVVEDMGLDAISTGVVLAWVTEAFEKGIISEKQTEGIIPEWGNLNAYVEIVRKIVYGESEFYKDIARGVDHASSKYGGKDFALTYGKNEMPGYHTGYGAHIGYLFGARHSHLDSAGYAIDKEAMTKHFTAEQIVEKILNEEQWRQILSSLVICFFGREIYTPEIVLKSLKLAGYELDESNLRKIAQDIYAEKYRFKIKSGFNFDSLNLPRRVFELPSSNGQINEDFARRCIEILKIKIRDLL
ncbi:MAG: aldehyde ferredoxin oxidoreductase family protein [Thermodesulfovibrio sp.]|uniref:aldehyde ferredoxin oxidoreductase family protein n=1 Tax=unclassified Thermodesulfovibrio TaxID=2645936 RepID=UPI00083A98CF|nr:MULTISPECIES: aldehyde ferredoxin oxidoreductase family protein [unclassified Thermodesulfovibrio]MDI1471250.1 aldehyde ferredoxin oxidoreductase family protein [Thermodesulfovibrio sp. 1176]MDI6714745.1 aldehyde ferredoxin oxidoreductase family protein [Thermodesulfovibrio sp.]ODA43483.1 Tungsten-containing aldehyde:ferredoxin oxidoreductase [Thermodesulfovibrio sp. N1]